MDLKDIYIDKLEGIYKSNFNITKNKKINEEIFELYAHYKEVTGRTFITKEDIIDKYEFNEHCLIKKIHRDKEGSVESILKYGIELAKKNDIVKTNLEHRKSNLTFILLTSEEVCKETINKIEKFRYERYHKFYLHGTTEVRFVLVDLNKEKVYTSKAAKELKNIYEPQKIFEY